MTVDKWNYETANNRGTAVFLSICLFTCILVGESGIMIVVGGCIISLIFLKMLICFPAER